MNNWKNGSVLAIDTETTGLGEDARVCAVACVEFRRGRYVEMWSSLCNPGPDVRWENQDVMDALHVNGLTPQDLANAPDYRYVMRRVADYAERCPVWAGHNIGFDLRLLGLGQHIRRAPDAILDTLLADVTFHGRHPSPPGRSLRSVAIRWNQDNFEEWKEHTAIGDAMTVARIIQAMWDKLPNDTRQLPLMMQGGYVKRCIEVADREGYTVQKPEVEIEWYGKILRRHDTPWRNDSEDQ